MRLTEKSHFIKRCSVALAVIAISSNLALTSCGGHNSPYSYVGVSVSIAPQVMSIPVNGAQTFTAIVTNSAPYVVWGVMGSQLSSPVGTFTTATTDAPTGTYTAPAAPPIYSAAQVAAGAVQGSVTLSAGVTTTPGSFNLTTTTLTFVITGPISVGISPATASVHVSGTQQFTGYAVGSVNNAITWQVNGVSGGGTATGTITTAGLYTAPTALPMTGNTVTITAVSQADPTKSASSVVTLASP